MNCAKSVKMIVILGCIVVNLVGCGMNDTTASSMSTVVSSQDTSSSSCNSEEKNDLQDFSQTLVDSTSVFLDQDQYTVFEKAQKIDYALWGQSSNLKGLNFKIEDTVSLRAVPASSRVRMTPPAGSMTEMLLAEEQLPV